MNMLDNAVTDFTFVIEHTEKDVMALLWKGTALSRIGRHAEARADYLRAMQQKPELAASTEEGDIPKIVTAPPARSQGSVEDFYSAIKQFSQGAHNEAPAVRDSEIEKLNAGIEEQPDNDVYYYQRAMQYQKQGKLEKALADLREAIRINPMRAQYYLARA